MARIIAFSGLSNSGKTTLIERLTSLLIQQGKSVFVLKHDPKNKAIFDTEGKDSYRFFKQGADVGVLSPLKTSFFLQDSLDLQKIIKLFLSKDYIFIEGLKELQLPRIIIARDIWEEEYQGVAYAVKNVSLPNISKTKILQLDDAQAVLNWIDLNIKETKEMELHG